jgi:predicted nucleic acid-binding protein
MRILVDTNVILDYIAVRKPFSESAYQIMTLCTDKKIKSCIAAHTISNLFFILRKDFSNEERRDILQKLCKIFTVIGIDSKKLESALLDYSFTDFEDCLQMECAKEFKANFIVTRNTKDYKNSSIKAINPDEFLKQI